MARRDRERRSRSHVSILVITGLVVVAASNWRCCFQSLSTFTCVVGRRFCFGTPQKRQNRGSCIMSSRSAAVSRQKPADRRLLAMRALSDVPAKWKMGPVEVFSGPAQKALYILQTDPMLFESSVEEELAKLQKQTDEAKRQETSHEMLVESDALVLRRRVKEIRDNERTRTATELLYLKICHRFIQLDLPLIPPLQGGGDIKFGQSGVNLKGLTDIYSLDALTLVRDHLFSILGVGGNPFRSTAVVQIALFQAGQVYAMASLFGYYVRRVDARYQLEKLAGVFGSFGKRNDDSSASFSDDVDQETVRSLKDYITTFGPEELQRMRSIVSVEAQMAMERHVFGLFGDLRVLKETLLRAVGMVVSNEEATQKLEHAIEERKVESVRITTEDFQRLVLEALAFGALLYDSEKQANSFYELTPSSNRPMGTLTGGDDMDTGRMLLG